MKMKRHQDYSGIALSCQNFGQYRDLFQECKHAALFKFESLLIEVETGNLGDLEMFVVRLAGDLNLESVADRLASILEIATEEDADFLVGRPNPRCATLAAKCCWRR